PRRRPARTLHPRRHRRRRDRPAPHDEGPRRPDGRARRRGRSLAAERDRRELARGRLPAQGDDRVAVREREGRVPGHEQRADEVVPRATRRPWPQRGCDRSMTIHVQRTGSTGSWVRLALMIAFVAAALATGYFGLRA